MSFLLRDLSFQARRRHAFRILKLCCLVVTLPQNMPPVLTMDLMGSSVSAGAFDLCLRLVQTYVLSNELSNQAFFSKQTLDTVRIAVADAGVFFVTPSFDVWKDFGGPRHNEFLTRICSSYHKLLVERRKACESYYVKCNKTNRQSQIERGRGDAAAGIFASATLGSKEGETEAAKKSIKKSSVKRGSSSKSSTTNKPSSSMKKQKSDTDDDLGLVHRLR